MKKSQKNFQVINSELSISWVEICENRQKFLEKKFRKYLVSSEKSRNFASQSRETRELPAKRLQNAKIAQLVEHNLAKVGVAGSSPVFRSNYSLQQLNVQVAELVDALLWGGSGH